MLSGLGNPEACFLSGIKAFFIEHRGYNDLRRATDETNRISAGGSPTLCTSVVVPAGLPRANPVSTMPKSIQKDKTKQIEYNI
jgi:hypothetical protein